MTVVQRIATWVPVLDEDIVDYGIGTPEDQRLAAARIEVRRAELTAYWRSLPAHERFQRRVLPRIHALQRRLDHAAAALRGEECEP